MNPSDVGRRARRRWVIWILGFGAVAAPLWPNYFSLACMALALFGVLHLGILIHDEIIEDDISSRMTPTEYERFCAVLLSKRGWATHLTKASHDQGVDIVATKSGKRIVIQCKKYGRPVGNHAVQQIAAAIAHEQADRGVVVATTAFTRSARKLAESNNILLLHHRDLPRIDRLLRR
jgi:restriction system protein